MTFIAILFVLSAANNNRGNARIK